MKKVLFVCLHRPDRAPSQRFRFEQYLSYLNSHGYECEFSWLLDEKDDKAFYSPHNYFFKTGIVLRSAWKRWKEIHRAANYNIVFVQRECFMLGTSFFEKQFAKRTKMIFDFDDSIWLPNISSFNRKLAFLKSPGKTRYIIEAADLVIAGNQYLSDYASQFNKKVVIIPVTIDTDLYQLIHKPKKERICIGWSGSVTTIEHMETKINVLEAIKKKYGEGVYFKIIGDGNYYNEILRTKGLPWVKKTEIEDMGEFDIGVMPLPDTEWAKGKCGLKGLQYMSLGIPTIMSPVGVNTEIIKDGVDGFLAGTDTDWIEKLSMLIDSVDLRKRLGEAGRKIVEKRYSIKANQALYLKYFDEMIGHSNQ
jgi:glycosyltransferase involved in cell wall biosynthesis